MIIIRALYAYIRRLHLLVEIRAKTETFDNQPHGYESLPPPPPHTHKNLTAHLQLLGAETIAR